MKLLTTILILFSLFQVSAQEAWTQLNDFPFETQSRDSFIFQGEAYIITGLYLDGNDDAIYRYNLAEDSWTFITTIPSNYAAPFVLNDLVYFLAYEADESVNLWEYDLLNNSWQQKSEVEDQYSSLFGAYKPHSFVIDGVAHIILPGDGVPGGATAKKYIPSEDIWESIAPWPNGNIEGYLSSFIAQGKAYTIYGIGPENTYNDMYVYDTILDTWEQKTDAPFEYLESPIVLPIGDEVYVGGGNIIGPPNLFFHRYNIELDTWEQVEDPNYSVDRAFGFVLDGRGYFGTGRFFDPDSGDGYLDRQSVYRLEPEFLLVEDTDIVSPRLFPNPTANFIILSNLKPKSSLNLYNVLGKSLSISFISDAKIDTSHLAPGLYFLSINSPEGSQTLKFVKQ